MKSICLVTLPFLIMACEPADISPKASGTTKHPAAAPSDAYAAKRADEIGFSTNVQDPYAFLKKHRGSFETEWDSQYPSVQTTSAHNFEISRIFCGIKSDTSLWCAGKPDTAVYIGNGTTRTDGAFHEILSSGVSQVATNQDLTCAIQHGKLLCWGMAKNNSGEAWSWALKVDHLPLIDGKRFSTTPVEIIPANVVSITLGFHRSCALLTGGELRCWGWDYGSTPKTVIASGASEVYLGPYLFSGMRSCSRVNGALKCWEDAKHSQIKTVLSAAELEGVTSISVGLIRICYVKNSGLYCNLDQRHNSLWGPTSLTVDGKAHTFNFQTAQNYDFVLAHKYESGVSEVWSYGIDVVVSHSDGSLSRTGNRDGVRRLFIAGTDIVFNGDSFRRWSRNASLIGIHDFRHRDDGINNSGSVCATNRFNETICLRNSQYYRVEAAPGFVSMAF